MLLEAVIVIIICLVIAWIISRWIFRKYTNLGYQLPCNRWHRFFAFGPIINRKDVIVHLYDYGIKYGPNSVLWVGPLPLYLTSDPDTIKTIFTSKNCVNKPHLIMNGITYISGIGMLSSNEPVWSRERKVFNKSFSHKNLLSFLPIFNEGVNNLIMEFNTNLEKGNNFDILEVFRHFTLKITSKTILKRNVEKTNFDSTTLVYYLNKILDYTLDGCVNIHWKIDWLRELIKKFKFKDVKMGAEIYKNFFIESWNIIKHNNKTKDSSYLPEVNATIDYFLKGVEENMMQEDDLFSEIAQIFFPAFETSSSALYYVLILLAMHPEYQQKTYEEIVNILPANNNDDLTLEHLNQLIYLEMVVNETMRVLPVVTLVVREVSNENLKLSNGVTLNVGQFIAIDIFSLHRSKNVWGPNATSFNPDNFLPTNVANQHPFAFIPFTKGQRFCIGWRYATIVLKISLAKLIRTYKFSTDFKFENLELENHISSKLVEEPQLYLERRIIEK